ncbi:tetratricopeptide repeat protein [Massilia sp. W12]|uniref:tetratricopeptide repeat protein n=1 Tax=Massilia sp. W12 TaxID=3126507 RepID=UPI0030CF66FB
MQGFSSHVAYYRLSDPQPLAAALDRMLEAAGWRRCANGAGSLKLGIVTGGKGWLALVADDFGWLARRGAQAQIHFTEISKALAQPGFLLATHAAAPYFGAVLLEADGRGKAVASGNWHDQTAAAGQESDFFDLPLEAGKLNPRSSALKTLRAQAPHASSEEFCRHVARTLLALETPDLSHASLMLEYAPPLQPKYADGQLMQVGDAVLWNRGLYPARICNIMQQDGDLIALLLQDCRQPQPFALMLQNDSPLLVARNSIDFAADCVRWLEQRSAARDARALTILANLMLQGIAVEADTARAEQLLQSAADMGLGDAQYLLGLQYSLGETLPRNDANAYTLLRSAARNGHMPAALLFGKLYLEGRGVSRDMRQALRWISQAAQAGLLEAQSTLGILYSNPQYGLQNGEQAMYWLQLAAQAGDAAAQYSLGLQYMRGQFTEQDFAQARHWYEQAEQAGMAEAACNLGAMAEHGQGMPLNHALAAELYRSAAERGVAAAMYSLGMLYQRGLGVPADEGLARQWMAQAAAGGYRNT